MTPIDNFASPDLQSSSRAFLSSRRRPAPFALRCLAFATLIALCASLSACFGGLAAFLPVIVTITPNSIPAGGPAQTITITGTGFASAVPLANGTALAITSVSSTQIVAILPASLTASPGTIAIVVVNLLPSGNLTSKAATITVTSSVTQAPELTITKSHTGDFTQGGTGTYTIAVGNSGNAPTSGTVTVTEMPPSGLTVTDIAGTGWTCTISSFTCDRSDALGAGASYPAITVTVTVATNAPSSVTNVATVTGDDETAESSDPTTITSASGPMLAITGTASPNPATAGGTTQYTITVTNNGTSATSGTVTVTASLASSETPGSINGGSAWSCTLSTLTCTTTLTFAPGQSLNSITIDVAIATNAPSSVTDTFTESGGNSPTSMTMVTITVNP